MRVTRHHSCRVTPFGHPRIHARLAAPRGLSQPPTSFIGAQCQGIHHAPLHTYKHQKTLNKNRLPQSLPDARNHYPTLKHHTPPPRGAQHHHGCCLKTQQCAGGYCLLPNTSARRHNTPNPHPTRDAFTVLPRKEVIQPHLPVRLPCYDFVPIADPTFDASLPKRG